MSQKLPKTVNYSSCRLTVFGHFDLFWGFKGFKNHIEPIFFMRGPTQKNFSLKFQIREKMMAALPRTKLVQRICWCGHVQYACKVLKIGFVFFSNNFRVIYPFLGTVYSTTTWLKEQSPILRFSTFPWKLSEWKTIWMQFHSFLTIQLLMLPLWTLFIQ